MRTWLKAYRVEGLAGLRHTPQLGRPATKGQGVTKQIAQLFVHSPSHFGYLEEGWTVDLLRDYLAQHQEAVSDATVAELSVCRTLLHNAPLWQRVSAYHGVDGGTHASSVVSRGQAGSPHSDARLAY